MILFYFAEEVSYQPALHVKSLTDTPHSQQPQASILTNVALFLLYLRETS